ncbi:MAG: GNAT family N-acetyltransferase [Pseudomonadota bacterium]
MNIRPVRQDDAEGICAVLKELTAAGKRTRPSDLDFVRANYVDHPDKIDCFVAEDDDGTILGFQSLRLATEGNEFGTPVGWAMAGTHISPRAARKGIGAKLFAATKVVALQAGVPAIEAYIGASNEEGLAYYEAMGFRTYREPEGAICKSYAVG